MSSDGDGESVSAALGSVRRLEGALEASSAERAAAESRLQAARSEASRLLAAARKDAAAAVAARRRSVLDSAEEDAAAIHREGEAHAALLRAHARQGREAVVDAAVALILPAGDEPEV